MGRLVADGWFYRNLLSTINIPILLPRSGVVKAHLAISAHSLTLNFMSSYFTPLSSQCPGVDGELIPSPPLPEKRKEIVSWRFPRKVKAQGGPVERRPKASKEKKSLKGPPRAGRLITHYIFKESSRLRGRRSVYSRDKAPLGLLGREFWKEDPISRSHRPLGPTCL